MNQSASTICNTTIIHIGNQTSINETCHQPPLLDHPNDDPLPFNKDLLRAFLVVIYSFIFLLGVPGNILVILTITRVKKMRSVKNLLIANIAIGDLISILWCLTTTLLGLFIDWPYGLNICKYLNTLSDVIIGNTVFTMVLITFERYRAIISPFSSKPTLRRTVLALTFFWIVSYTLIGIPLIKATRITYGGFWVRKMCSLIWPSRAFEITYRMGTFIFVFLGPFFIVLFCFLRIKLKLEENIRFASTSLRGRSTIKRAKKNQRLIKMLLVIFVCFTACFLPVNILLLAFTFFKRELFAWKYLIVFLQMVIAVLFLNSTMNPIILYLLSRDFRMGYIQQIKCLCPSNAKLQRAVRGIKRISTYSFRLSGKRNKSGRARDSSSPDDFDESSSSETEKTENDLLPCLQTSDWLMKSDESSPPRNGALFVMNKMQNTNNNNNNNENKPKKVSWSHYTSSLE
ncbi:neuropeptide Y receptor type 6-like [Clytia hemisphaerica]|uniref:G-protein coupled receptors family 1 profile domain-containing protein n=1 Tax=Clytia hemisphaerica TaxID=252671 RepID=A0A7M5X4A7_9CNID